MAWNWQNNIDKIYISGNFFNPSELGLFLLNL